MVETVSRRKIVRACKSRGWMVQPAALSGMHRYLNLQEKDYTEDVLKELARRTGKNTKVITEELWAQAFESEEVVMSEAGSGLDVVDAFDMPRIVFDSMRKTFRVEAKRWPLLGSAADKVNMMAQRYDLVHQRMLRHDLFRNRKSNHSDTGQQQHTLTPIESLLGKQNSDRVPVLVLGILVQVEEGQYYLEDASGRVQVSFCNAIAVDAFYVTENSILLMEATFQDEVLYVDRVGPPFLEQRAKTLQLLQQQVRHNHFVPSSDFGDDANNSLVVVCDAHLDQPRVLTLLEGLFESYSSYTDPKDLPVFCLMGNFTSSPQIPAYQGWEELAIIIAKFPFLSRHAHFVFIPGPYDTKSAIFPQFSVLQATVGLKRMMQSYQLKNVHWASNPCRILQNGKEIVLFRHEILSWMLQNQVRLPQLDQSPDRAPHSKMIKTILDQGHLMPVARAPIYWNYDHALRLYPLPDALILGGSSSVEDYEIYEDCDTIQPGSFSKNGTYAIFSTSSNDMDSTHEEGESRSRVQFCQVRESSN